MQVVDEMSDDDAILDAEDEMHEDSEGVVEFPSSQPRGAVLRCIELHSIRPIQLYCTACYSTIYTVASYHYMWLNRPSLRVK